MQLYRAADTLTSHSTTTVDELILAGANVDNAIGTNGQSPLYVAAEHRHIDIAKALITQSRQPVTLVNKARNDGTTPLWIAAKKNHFDMVDYLISVGANPDQARTDTGITPLWMAARDARIGMVEKLISVGANPDQARTDTGTTPLWIAARAGFATIVSKLLDLGADKSIRDFRKRTPLDALLSRKYHTMNKAEIIKRLQS